MVYDYPYHRNNFYNNFYNNIKNTNEDNFKNDINRDNYENFNINNSENNLNKKNLENIKENKISKNNDRCVDDDSVINILGIKLSFDDLLILGLLYILYSEGNKDISLYIVLILLLMS